MCQRSKLPPPSEFCNPRRVALLPVTQPKHQKLNMQKCIKHKFMSLVQSAIPAYKPRIQTTSMAMMWKICNYNGKCTMLINFMPRKSDMDIWGTTVPNSNMSSGGGRDCLDDLNTEWLSHLWPGILGSVTLVEDFHDWVHGGWVSFYNNTPAFKTQLRKITD